MARKHRARRFVESADSFKPRLPRGIKQFVQTRPTKNALPTTERGARRPENEELRNKRIRSRIQAREKADRLREAARAITARGGHEKK